MNKNMGSADRKLRAFVMAPALVVVGLVVGPGGWLPVVLYVLSAVMAGTAAVGSCPLYTLFGLRSCPIHRIDAGDPEHISSR